MWDLIYFLDLTGTFVFAISGALSGIEKKYDIFGIIFLAFITAIGGGTTRDVLLVISSIYMVLSERWLLLFLQKPK